MAFTNEVKKMEKNVGLEIPEFKLENWLPMPPDTGPPLPRFLGITWPWYRPPAPPEEYVCPYCGAKFSTEAEALAHIEMEHPEEPPIVHYTCTICGATFTTQEDLDTHILAEHPEEVPEIPPSGEILDITWWDGASWRPLTEPIPAYTYITYRFRVKNTGSTVGAFKIGWTWYSDFSERWEWFYSPSFNIEADTEGNIDWEQTSGPATFTITFYLFADDIEVDSVTVTITTVW